MKLFIRTIATVIITITNPSWVDTKMVFALKLVMCTVGAIGKASRTTAFISGIGTVSSTITFQLTRHTVSALTLKVSRKAGPHVTVALIRVVPTVVGVVTHPSRGNASLVAASKLTLCALSWDTVFLIRVIATVIMPVTFPAKRNAAVIAAAELSCGSACPRLTAFFITVIPAVIDAIANSPLWDAAVVCPTGEFCMVVTAICRAHAFIDRLIRVVTTVIVYVTLPGLRNAAAIGTLKIARLAGPAGTVRALFIRVIPTVVLRVTLPGFWDATFVGTLPLIGLALVILTKSLVFIRAIRAVLVGIAQRLRDGTVAILALEPS